MILRKTVTTIALILTTQHFSLLAYDDSESARATQSPQQFSPVCLPVVICDNPSQSNA